MRKRGYLFLAIAVLLSGFILFTSTNSGASHSALGGRIITWVNAFFFAGTLSSAEQSAIVGVAGKLFGHFSLFLLDGLSFYLFLKETRLSSKKKALLYLSLGLLLSVSGEIIQLFSEGRYGNVFDVIIDFSGFLLPYLFLIGLKALD